MTIVLVEPAIDASTLDFTKYSSYIDAIGLLEWPEGEKRVTSTQLRPTRQDVGQNSWETRPESGDVFSQGDFRGGMGQVYFHRGTPDESTRYLFSQGFEATEDGTLRHHKRWVNWSTTHGLATMAIANSILFGAEPNSTNLISTSDFSTINTEAIGGNANEITTDGTNVYIGTTANGIRKRDSAGTFTDEWLAGNDASHLLWTMDRLIFYDGGNGTLHEKVPGGTVTTIDTIPSAQTVRHIWSNGKFIYVAVISATGTRGHVRHYGLNAAGSAIESKGSTELPIGVQPLAGYSYIGATFLLCSEVHGGTAGAIEDKSLLLHARPQEDGSLVYDVVARTSVGQNGAGPNAITSDSDTIFARWDTAASEPYAGGGIHILAFDLARGAASLLPALVTTHPGNAGFAGMTFYQGRLVVGTVTGTDNSYATHPTEYAQTATLITSIADWNNAGIKTWSELQIAHKPLPAGGSIAVYYTTQHPKENSWTLAGTSDTVGSEGATFTLSDVNSRIFALKIVSTRGTDATTAPEFLSYSVRSDPTPATPEWDIVKTFCIFDVDRLSPNGSLVRQTPRDVIDSLQLKLHDWVTFYEPHDIYSARIEAVQIQEMDSEVASVTAGEAVKEAFLVNIALRGTKV